MPYSTLQRGYTVTEYGLPNIDWLSTPLEEFLYRSEKQEDGTVKDVRYPHGDSFAPSIIVSLVLDIERAYESLIPYDTDEYGNLVEGYPDALRWERCGEVPVIRNGHRRYESFDSLTLSDLPALLDTLVMLEEEKNQRDREEAERKAAAQKERARIRAKERRKLKKLGEW